MAGVNDNEIDNVNEWVKSRVNVKGVYFDKQVLEFIARFLHHVGKENSESIRKLFSAGYCYYFANMLRLAFNRGRVMYSLERGHIVWEDTDELLYDINGPYIDYIKVVPIEKLGVGVKDFNRVPGSKSGMSDEEIKELQESLLEDDVTTALDKLVSL